MLGIKLGLNEMGVGEWGVWMVKNVYINRILSIVICIFLKEIEKIREIYSNIRISITFYAMIFGDG